MTAADAAADAARAGAAAPGAPGTSGAAGAPLARSRGWSRVLSGATLLAVAAACAGGLVWWASSGDAWVAVLVIADALTAAVVGWLVVRRRPGNVVGPLLLAHGLTVAVLFVSPDEAARAVPLLDQLFQGAWVLLYVFIALIAYTFPDGRFPSRRWRRFVQLCLAGHVVFMVCAALDVDSFRETYPGVEPPIVPPAGLQPWITVPGVLGLVTVPVLLVGAVVCAAGRLHRAEGEERRQMLWFTWAALSVPAGLALCWADAWLTGETGGPLTSAGVLVSGTVLPLAIGVAILRSRLFDIELVLSRTVTYGALTVLVVAVYGGVLLVTRAVAGSDDLAGLLGVGVVAVAVHPVHARLRRRVDRWVYGDRADPYAALRRLSDRLAETGDPDQVVRTVTASVAEALRVDRVTVELDRAAEPPASRTDDGTQRVAVPLTHSGRALGRLVVEVPPGRTFSAADRQLLDELARHAAVVVEAVYLDLDLAASRARLVTAREEERRRIRRDLHDGLGPALAAIVLKLDAVGRLAPDAGDLVSEVRGEARTAIEDVRRLVDDLRPPALDEVGLVAAVRQRAEGLARGCEGLVVEVVGPPVVAPLPAAVEVAAYRIAAEAVTNVVRHAGATRCVVTLEVGGSVEVTVADNGHQPWDPDRVGVGWASMRERASELGGVCHVARRPGGGTEVRAVLPVSTLAEPAATREGDG